MKKEATDQVLFKALFEQATEGILIVTEAGKILLANAAARAMFGYEIPELEGQSIEILIPTDLRRAHARHREQFRSDPHPRSMGLGLNLHGQRKDGSVFPVEISLSPFDDGAGGQLTIAFVIDITVREQLAQQRANIAVELEKEKELGALKSRFVNIASHEFRTPLATILSSAGLINSYADRSDFENVKRHTARIKNSVNHLQNILQEFLSLGKIEDGKVEPKIEAINLPELLHEIEEDLKPILKKGQKITCQHAGETIAQTDRNLLRIIAINLISNAIKYSPEDSPIEVECRAAAGKIEIVVRDRGIGISENDQRKLFERFFRASNSGSTTGTGLGLYIVKRYAELLGGSVAFSSQVGEGSEFRVWLVG